MVPKLSGSGKACLRRVVSRSLIEMSEGAENRPLSSSRKIVLLLLCFSSFGCSSKTKQNIPLDSEFGEYHESAYNDLNKPPAQMVPPDQYSGKLEESQKLRTTSFVGRTKADYKFSLGEAYSLEGDSAKAIDSFREVLLYDPENITVKTRLGLEFLKQGRITESIEQLEQAISKNSENTEARLLLAGVYTTMKLYPKAIDQYQEILKYDSDHVDAMMYLGAVFAEEKKYDIAIKQFELLLKNAEFNQPHLVHYYIGKVRQEQNEEKYLKAAEKEFKIAVDLKPDFVDAILALGEIYKQRKQVDLAIKLYKTFQREHGPNVKVADLLAQHYLEKGLFDQAYEQLEILESVNEYSINVKLKLALILIERKEYRRAIGRLEEILKEVPDSDKVRFYLGAVYEELKEDDKALVEFKRLNAQSVFYSESVIHAAYLLKKKDKLNEAIGLLEKALEEAKDQYNLYAMYASLLDEKGDYETAQKVLEKGVHQFPNNPQIRFFYGTISDRLGNKDKVVEEMKKVIELDPKHVQGLNYLAFTLAEMNKNLDEAENFAKRANLIDPRDGYILDTLGWVMFKKGDWKESIKYLEKALKEQPNVSIIAEHLGDAYVKALLIEKALKMYMRAVELETDNKKVSALKSKITSLENQRLNSGRIPASLQGQ